MEAAAYNIYSFQTARRNVSSGQISNIFPSSFSGFFANLVGHFAWGILRGRKGELRYFNFYIHHKLIIISKITILWTMKIKGK
jgi:hypothetical protein